MGEHYTRNTVSAEAWCLKCGKRTQHRIDGVRLGPCLDCIAELDRQREEFEERAAIKEFLGNMPREQAEREAREEVYGVVEKSEQELKLWTT